MIKLTRNALTMLLAHYRAIYKNAYIKGALAAVAAAGLGLTSTAANADLAIAANSPPDTPVNYVSGAIEDTGKISGTIAAGYISATSFNAKGGLLSLKATAGYINITGSAAASGAVTLTAGTNLTVGAVTASGASTLTATAGTLTLNGDLSNTVAAGALLKLESTAGAIALGSSTITNTSGNVSLTASGGITGTGKITATKGTLTIKDTKSAISIGDVEAGGTATISGATEVTVGAITTSGATTVTAKAGTLTISGAIKQTADAGNVALNSTAGAIALGSNTITNDSGNVTLTASGGITGTGKITATNGSLTVTDTKGAVSIGELESTAGAVSVTGATDVTVGAVTASGATSLTATAGTLTLNGALKQTADGSNVKLVSTAGAIALGSNTVTNDSGNVTLTASGGITGTGKITATNGSLTVTDTAGAISVGEVESTAGQVTVSGATAVTVGAVTASGATTVTAKAGKLTVNGDVKQTADAGAVALTSTAGALEFGSNTITNDSGNVTLSATAGVAGTGKITATKGSLTVKDTGGAISIGEIESTAGTATVSGSAAVTVGKITASGAVEVTGTAGLVTLEDEVTSSAGTITITGSGVSVGGNISAAAASAVAITASTGAIEFANAVTLTGITTLDTNGATSLDNVTLAQALTLKSTGGDGAYAVKTLDTTGTAGIQSAVVVESGTLSVSETLGADATDTVTVKAGATLDASEASTYKLTAASSIKNSGTVKLNGASILTITAGADDEITQGSNTAITGAANSVVLKDTDAFVAGAVTNSAATSTLVLTGLDGSTIYYSDADEKLYALEAALISGGKYTATGDSVSFTGVLETDAKFVKLGADGSQVDPEITEGSNLEAAVISEADSADAITGQTTSNITSDTEVASVQLVDDDGLTGNGADDIDTLVLTGNNTLTLSDAEAKTVDTTSTNAAGNFVTATDGSAANVVLGGTTELALNGDGNIGNVTAQSDGDGTLTVGAGTNLTASTDGTVKADSIGTAQKLNESGTAVSAAPVLLGEVSVVDGTLAVENDLYADDINLGGLSNNDNSVQDGTLTIGGNAIIGESVTGNTEDSTLVATGNLQLGVDQAAAPDLSSYSAGTADDGVVEISGADITAAVLDLGKNALVIVEENSASAYDDEGDPTAVGSTISAAGAKMNGATLFVDPSVVFIDDLLADDTSALDNVNNATDTATTVLSGNIVVGEQSLVYIGTGSYTHTNSTGVQALLDSDGQLADASTTNGGNFSVLYTEGDLTIGEGFGVTVDGNMDSAAFASAYGDGTAANRTDIATNTVKVTDGGTLFVNGALSFSGTAETVDGETVYQGKGSTFTLASGDVNTTQQVYAADGTVQTEGVLGGGTLAFTADGASVTAETVTLTGGQVAVGTGTATIKLTGTSGVTTRTAAFSADVDSFDIEDGATLVLDNSALDETTASYSTLSTANGLVAVDDNGDVSTDSTNADDGTTIDGTLSLKGTWQIATGSAVTNLATEDRVDEKGADVDLPAGTLAVQADSELQIVGTGAVKGFYELSNAGTVEFATTDNGSVDVEKFTQASTGNLVAGKDGSVTAGIWDAKGSVETATGATLTLNNDSQNLEADLSAVTFANTGTVVLSGAATQSSSFKLKASQLDTTKTAVDSGSLLSTASTGLKIGANTVVTVDGTVDFTGAGLTSLTGSNAWTNASTLDVTTAVIDGTAGWTPTNVYLVTDTLKSSGTLAANGAPVAGCVLVSDALATTVSVSNSAVLTLGETGSDFNGGSKAIYVNGGTVNINGNSTTIGAISYDATNKGYVTVNGTATIASVDTTNATPTYNNGFKVTGATTVSGQLTGAANTILVDGESASLSTQAGKTTLAASSVTLMDGGTLNLHYADVVKDLTATTATKMVSGAAVAENAVSADADSTVYIDGFSSSVSLTADQYNILRDAVFSSVTKPLATNGTGLLSTDANYDTSSLDVNEDGKITQTEANAVNGEFARNADVVDISADVTGTRSWRTATLSADADDTGLLVGTTAAGNLTLTNSSTDASTPYVKKSDGTTAANVQIGGTASQGELHLNGSGTLADVTFGTAGGELGILGTSGAQATSTIHSLTGNANADLTMNYDDLTVTSGDVVLGDLGINNGSLTVKDGSLTVNGTDGWLGDTAKITAQNITAASPVYKDTTLTATGDDAAVTLTGGAEGATIQGNGTSQNLATVSITGGAIQGNTIASAALPLTGAATLTADAGQLGSAAAKTASSNSVYAPAINFTAGDPTQVTGGVLNPQQGVSEVKGNTLTAGSRNGDTTADATKVDFKVGTGTYDQATDTVTFSPAVAGNTLTADQVAYTLGNYVTVGSADGTAGDTVTAAETFDVDLGDIGTSQVFNSTFTSTAQGSSADSYVSEIQGELTAGNTVATLGSTLALSDDLAVLGTADSPSTVTSKWLDLGGNLLFIDPAYVWTGSLVNGTATNTLNGDLVVGAGSAFYVGAEDSANNDIADTAALKSYLSSVDYDSVAYLESEVTLTAGSSIVVDNDLTSDNVDDKLADATYAGSGDAVYVGAGDAIVVTGDALGDYVEGEGYTQGAIHLNAAGDSVDVDGTVVVQDINLSNGDVVTVFDVGTGTAVAAADIAVASYKLANGLYTAYDRDNGSLRVGYDEDNAAAWLEHTDDSIAGPLKEFAQGTGVMKASSFVNKALSLPNSEAVGKSLNSAARIAVLGGATQNAQLAHRAYTDALEERQGFIAKTSSSIGQVQGTDVTVWVTPLYVTQDSDGYDGGKSGDLGVDGKLWGVTLGVDGALENGLTIGAAFHVGSGDSDHNGSGYEKTDGDFDFWGLSLYGAYTYEGFKFLGDISYTAVDNDIDQDNAAGHLQADIDSKLLSVGLQGKYDIDVDGITITPHIGLRYHHLDVDSYTVNFARGDNFDGKSFDANYVTFPIGIGVSKDILTSGGWTVKPAADFSIIPVAGDKDVKTKIVSNDITMSANSDISDDVLFRLRLGVDAQYHNFGLGFGYGYLGGSDTKSHNLSATLRYTF